MRTFHLPFSRRIASLAIVTLGGALVPIAARAQLPFEPETGTNYLIIEGTKGERFAAGSDNNVLRWASSGGKEQRWQFVKSDKHPGRYKIKSLKDNGDKVLDVQWFTGNVSIYEDNGKVEQTYTLQKLLDPVAQVLVPDLYNKYHALGVDFVWINEGSRNERVAIGSIGRAVRWAANNESSQVFILRKEPAGTDAIRKSYDKVPYKLDPNNAKDKYKYIWADRPPFTRTIYNPLDGGVLLKYTQTTPPANSDGGCSTGAVGKLVFEEACLVHDANYDAPFNLAGFPKYTKTGISTGQELADYLFLKDMLQSVKERPEWERNLAETVAYSLFRGAEDFGKFRGGFASEHTVVEKGGAIAVKNNGLYFINLRVEWIAPGGAERVEEINNHGERAAVIPLSIGAKNIVVTCNVIGGNQLFQKTYAKPGMYSVTVKGNPLGPQVVYDVLEDESQR
jgi:hypothetical protein